jgi:hypothetical protein
MCVFCAKLDCGLFFIIEILHFTPESRIRVILVSCGEFYLIKRGERRREEKKFFSFFIIFIFFGTCMRGSGRTFFYAVCL